MKRASIIVLAAVASVVLADCHSGSPSRPQASGGAIRSETTTSSSTTTTRPNMTGTTRIPAERVSRSSVVADCPGVVALEGTLGWANRYSLQIVSAQKGFAVDDTAVLVTDDGRTWNRRYNDSAPMFSVDAVVAWVYFPGQASGSHVGYAAYRGSAAGQWTPVMKEAQAGPATVQASAGGSSPGPMSALGTDSAMFVTFSPLATPPGDLRLLQATDGGRRLGPARRIAGLFSAMSVDFLSPDVGWVIGAKAGSSPIDAILATSDGGQTWQEQYSYTVPPPGG